MLEHFEALNFVNFTQRSFNIGNAVTAVNASHNLRAPRPGGLVQSTQGLLLMARNTRLTHLGFQAQPNKRPTINAAHKGTKLVEQSKKVPMTADEF